MEERKFTEAQVVVENVSGEPIAPRKKRGFELNGKDSVFKIIIAVSTVLLTIFGIWEGFRAGFTVTALIMFLSLTVYFINQNTRLRIFSILCGLLNCVVAASFATTSNSLIRFMSVICMMVLSAVWFMYLVKVPENHTDIALTANLAMPFFKSFTVCLPSSVAAIFRSDNKKRGGMGKILLGMVMALPVLVIVIPLLMLSDAAFMGLVNKILGESFFTAFKVLIGLIISAFVISYCFTLKKRELPKVKDVELGLIDSTIVVSFLSVLGFCYLGYLFSQLAYFFSAFRGILPENYEFTVSNYARRGFFEMCIIAVINFAIIFAVLVFSRKDKKKICITARLLCLFIGIVTLVIISTAISKMLLYIGSFGMTELRIYTSMFMIFLGLVFISLILRVFFTKVRVLKVAIVTAAFVLAVMGTVNVNNVIAGYNYNAYVDNVLKEMDVNTIYRLGDEGVPYLVKLTECKDEEVAQEAAEKVKRLIVNERYYELEREENADEYDIDSFYVVKEKKHDALGEYSIARANAYKALDGYIKENPEVLKIY